MRQISYIILALLLTLYGCQPEITQDRAFDLYQAQSIKAIPGDNYATITWTLQENKEEPISFKLTWTPDAIGLEGGTMEIDKSAREVVIKDLINDCNYTFDLQAIYPHGLSQKVSAKCTPKTSRFPVKEFYANAGSQRVLLKWKKPDATNLSSYTITWAPGNGKITLSDYAEEYYMIDNLQNDTEYTFTIVCNYPNGDSEPLSAKSTPGLVYPIIVSISNPIKNQPVVLDYNPMYFLVDEVIDVQWEFSDGSKAEGFSVVHQFPTEGIHTIKATSTYKNGTSDSGLFEINVSGFKWSNVALKMGEYTGFVKASNPVFAPDASKFYISTSNKAGDLFAIDTWTGEIRWTFSISNVTYGGGPVVGNDGTIYVGAQGAKFFAIKDNGELKWQFESVGNIEGFPAVTSSNDIYVVSNGPTATLYSLNHNNGSEKWSKELAGGTGSAVAVDSQGYIYVGTNKGVWSFNQDGTERWSLADLNVTERGSFAIDGNVLYAALKATDGIAAIDMNNGNLLWKSKAGSNDSYFPIVGEDGTIYYTSKGGKKVYAITPAGTLKWETKELAALIYAGLALTKDNILYTGTQAAIDGSRQLLTINANTGQVLITPSDQIMSAFSFGPDNRVYYGTVAGNIFTIETNGPASSWSFRGGNTQGTNSLK